MQRLKGIVGSASDPELAQRLHDLEHGGQVEYIQLPGLDMHRHRLHVRTDRGTDCAIILARSDRLSDGAILLLEEGRAIVVRAAEEKWLDLVPRDSAAALELGYFAGNMHWPVRFNGEILRIALHGPEKDYLARIAHLLDGGRIRRVGDVQ